MRKAKIVSVAMAVLIVAVIVGLAASTKVVDINSALTLTTVGVTGATFVFYLRNRRARRLKLT